VTLEVLQSRDQVSAARRELERRSLSCLRPAWKNWLARHGLVRGIAVGDEIKSWDVAKTAEFVESRVPKDQPVLDIGAFASEMPPLLHRLGYKRISALDLNPRIVQMPFAEAIDYRVGDFLRAPYAEGTFAAITAISVIEHGFDGERLAAEVKRLLRPGGFFIASFDFWPDKLATDGIQMFGLSWTIFSRADVQNFVTVAERHGLVPHGAMQFEAQGRPVSCEGRDYTFAWLVLQRRS
jgi:SAM-dependent methyltransferase